MTCLDGVVRFAKMECKDQKETKKYMEDAHKKMDEIDRRMLRMQDFMRQLKEKEQYFSKDEVALVTSKFNALAQERQAATEMYKKRLGIYEDKVLRFEKAESERSVLVSQESVQKILESDSELMAMFTEKHAEIVKSLRDAKGQLMTL
jgi:hypothetical protein